MAFRMVMASQQEKKPLEFEQFLFENEVENNAQTCIFVQLTNLATFYSEIVLLKLVIRNTTIIIHKWLRPRSGCQLFGII